MAVVRNVLVVLGVLIGAPLLLVLGAAAYLQSELPIAQADRVRGPHGLVGVQTGSSYAWIVPSATGVVLVDAGFDRAAKAIKREIGQREVRAVLLTHGHTDQLGGLAAFPDAPVYAHPADIPLATGEARPTAWISKAMASVMPPPPGLAGRFAAKTAAELDNLEIDGLSVRAVWVPGHTPGSVAWLWEDVLFTGDAVLGGSPLSLPPDAMNEDPAQVPRSVTPLLALDFDAIADSRVGLTGAARPALFRLAGAKETPPTVSVRTATGGEPGGGPIVDREGTYVVPPTPDVRGEQPGLVVFADGASWRVADRGDLALQGQRVSVRARMSPGGVPVGPVGPVTRVDAPPPPRSTAPADNVGLWIPVHGVLSGFAPLTPGARWGEARLTLDDGVALPISLPSDGPTEGAVTLTARVVAEPPGGMRLVALPIADGASGGASP